MADLDGRHPDTEPPPVLVNGQPSACVPADDRGFLYGDGVFETIALKHGVAPLWDYHRRRLSAACRRLGFDCPPVARLVQELAAVAPRGEAVVRLVLTRGRGSGYAPPAGARPTRVVMRVPSPARDDDRAGLTAGLCQTRLGDSPALAGLKHLGRLEQVLGAAEVAANGWDEGLMMDRRGQVVEATRGNVLACRDGRWTTPAVDRCGVAGVYRQYLLDRGAVTVAPLDRGALVGLDAVAVCNAVRGVRLVSAIAGVVQYRLDRAQRWLAVLER